MTALEDGTGFHGLASFGSRRVAASWMKVVRCSDRAVLAIGKTFWRVCNADHLGRDCGSAAGALTGGFFGGRKASAGEGTGGTEALRARDCGAAVSAAKPEEQAGRLH